MTICGVQMRWRPTTHLQFAASQLLASGDQSPILADDSLLDRKVLPDLLQNLQDRLHDQRGLIRLNVMSAIRYETDDTFRGPVCESFQFPSPRSMDGILHCLGFTRNQWLWPERNRQNDQRHVAEAAPRRSQLLAAASSLDALVLGQCCLLIRRRLRLNKAVGADRFTERRV